MSIIEIILSSNTGYVLLLYLISAKVQSRRFKEMISHILTKNVILVLHILVCTKWIYIFGLMDETLYIYRPENGFIIYYSQTERQRHKTSLAAHVLDTINIISIKKIT